MDFFYLFKEEVIKPLLSELTELENDERWLKSRRRILTFLTNEITQINFDLENMDIGTREKVKYYLQQMNFRIDDAKKIDGGNY